MLLFTSLLLLFLAVGTAATASAPQLPKVDLGYEVHQANAFDVSTMLSTLFVVMSFELTGVKSSTGIYNFSNIRYAQPPVGDLRFAAPVPPKGRSTKVNKGTVGTTCPQSDPAWLIIGEAFLTALATGQPFNYSQAFAEYQAFLASLPTAAASEKPDPRTTEDCLFLDVFVPKAVFDNQKKGKGTAVLVWIYGGGYTTGSKTDSGNPTGLIQRSQANGSPGVVYVAMNYRVRTTSSPRSLSCTTIFSARRNRLVVRTYIPSKRRDSECRSIRSAPGTRMGAEVHPPLRW